MKNPQTLAEKLYKCFPCAKLKSIKDYACCCFVLMWCLGYEPDDNEAIMTVSDMIDKKIIDPDCTVYWGAVTRYLTGRECSVEFEACSTIKGIKNRTPVKYSYNGHSHWVGVENGKIKFNSLENSVCVSKGKPVTKRILKISGGF